MQTPDWNEHICIIKIVSAKLKCLYLEILGCPENAPCLTNNDAGSNVTLDVNCEGSVESLWNNLKFHVKNSTE